MFAVGETDLVMEELNKSEDNRKIEEATRDQYLCDKWFAERKLRLTSSRFGLICKRKKAVTKKFCQKLVEGRDLRKVPAVAYGLTREAVALERFRVQMGLEVVRKAGFFICHRLPFLGATPDGIIPMGDETQTKDCQLEALVEIKCPYAHRFNGRAPDYLELQEDGQYELNKRHNYYYQVQGQLYVCEKDLCYFVVFTFPRLYIVKVYKDVDFCELHMIPKLKEFYFNYFKPMIVDE